VTKKTHSRRAATSSESPHLSSFDLFRDVPAASLAALEASSAVEDYKAGHLFFKPGDPGGTLFLLERGRVETFRSSRHKKLIIAELDPPAIFGEIGCVGPCLYHCFASAVEASRIRSVPKSQLDILLQKHPIVARRLLDLVSGRFVKVLLDLDATSFQRLIPRLAGFLLQHAQGEYVHDITHREIAERLRVYRESATAAIGELRKAGIIAVERRRICILDRARLERASRE